MLSSAAAARPAEPKGWLATIGVVIATVAVVGVGWAGSRAVLGLPDQPVVVAQGVQVFPPLEWEFAGRDDKTGDVTLTRGDGSLIVALGDRADPAETLALVKASLGRMGITATEIETVGDVHGSSPAARFAFSGTLPDRASGLEGEVTAVGGTNLCVVFIGYAGLGDYLNVSDDVARMIQGATIP